MNAQDELEATAKQKSRWRLIYHLNLYYIQLG